VKVRTKIRNIQISHIPIFERKVVVFTYEYLAIIKVLFRGFKQEKKFDLIVIDQFEILKDRQK